MTAPRPETERATDEDVAWLRNELARRQRAVEETIKGHMSVQARTFYAGRRDGILRILATVEYARAAEARLAAVEQENAAWRLAAARVSVAPAGTDVSTPSAFQDSQAYHSCVTLNELAALRTERDALREDAARLDWLEEQSEYLSGHWWDFADGAIAAGWPDLRSALDAARAVPSPTAGPEKHNA